MGDEREEGEESRPRDPRIDERNVCRVTVHSSDGPRGLGPEKNFRPPRFYIRQGADDKGG
jgi:hypothetical protein